MALGTNLRGRLRNTDLPKSHGLMPLYEAVVNSIQALEEGRVTVSEGEITIEILREDQPTLSLDEVTKRRGPDPLHKIIGFKVIDNGVGFNPKNFKSFETLDSEHKAAQGCRGVGRLLWLKAFDKIYIESVYLDGEGRKRKRTFAFDDRNEVSDQRDEPVDGITPCRTVVHLHGFEKTYREASLKSIEPISRALLEHCLWYFVRPGGAPAIQLIDGDETRFLSEVYDAHMLDSAIVTHVTIKDIDFELTHIKLYEATTSPHKIAYCAANRLIKEESINGKISGLYGQIADAKGDFIYGCYVRSQFLDDNVRSDRSDLTIPESLCGWAVKNEISMADIRSEVLLSAESYLAPMLEENRRSAKERIHDFVTKQAPRYMPIIQKLSDQNLHIDPNAPAKEIELFLHKHLYEAECKLLSEGHDIMVPNGIESKDDYLNRLDRYLSAVEDIKKSDLASYVSHRKVILDLLEKAIERDADGSYSREDVIHKLIVPMGVDSNEAGLSECNLWLLDERLTFHDYLASDKSIRSMPITGSTSGKEPDIIAMNVYDNPLLVSEGTRLPLASVTVVELKRPVRDDMREGEEKDPIEQALGYLDRIRQGGMMTAKGRPIPESENTPGFCYIIADLTPTMQTRCKMKGLIPTSDKAGYFGYNDNYKAYIEVISFTRLVNAAKERNRAFFDKLGLPCT